MISTPPIHQVDVAIIGGGIGGLATAIALRRAGIDAHVFERASELREIGGAVVVRETAAQLFTAWGLDDGFHEQAVEVSYIDDRDETGQLRHTLPADFTGEGRAWSAHRADVHKLLRSGVPADRLHLGAKTVEVHNERERAEARFDDGARVSARLVIGADGIRSVARRAIVEDEMTFAHLVVLRALAPAEAMPNGVPNERLQMWSRGPLRMVTLPLRSGTVVALDTAITQDEPPADLWSSTVPRSTVLEAFAGFDQGLLDLIAAGSDPVLANPVYDREPITRWSDGRIVLLGDAAHPMAPRQGQGANQAVHDAQALADALSAFGLDDVDAALHQYESVRVGPATAMQLASRKPPAGAQDPPTQPSLSSSNAQ